MVEAALNAAAEQVIEYTAYGTILSRLGNRSRDAAPQGLYPCRGHEQWLALSIASDGQWSALKTVLGQPGWADDPSLGTHEGRWRAHDLIDKHLEQWARQRRRSGHAVGFWGSCFDAVRRAVQPSTPAAGRAWLLRTRESLDRRSAPGPDHSISVPQCRSMVPVPGTHGRRAQRNHLEGIARIRRKGDRDAHHRICDRHSAQGHRLSGCFQRFESRSAAGERKRCIYG
jgi:crotonobetainyl-CoA:carnitine CoA-transferase CaiB-like acyl-CoA transferase